MRTPSLWQDEHWWMTLTLRPFALINIAAQRRRIRNTIPKKVDVPVICIGNLVAGGAGKTPVVSWLAHWLSEQGIKAHCLSRGYGGKEEGPLQVNTTEHVASDVGDEPLLLAEIVPTWISHDRVAGAKAAIAAGAECIIMDDGFQNPSLHKTLSVLVIDGQYGFGNEEVMPLGPLREPIEDGLARTDMVIIMGEETAEVSKHLTKQIPIFRAYLKPDNVSSINKRSKIIAFAGIGRPQKFFDTVATFGAEIAATISYADHHRYSQRDIEHLLRLSFRHNAKLVTTAKDMVRIPRRSRHHMTVIPVSVDWEEGETFGQTLLSHIRNP